MLSVIVLRAATTAERFFRIDQAQEHLHYATDIFSENLFIVYLESNVDAAPADSSVLQEQDSSHLFGSNLPTEETSLQARDSTVCGHLHLHRVNAKRSLSSPTKSSRYDVMASRLY